MSTYLQTRPTPQRFLVITSRLSLAVVSLLTLAASAVVTHAADPAAELASFSVFNSVDLAQLQGEAKPVRGPAMNSSRFQSVQTCWVAPGAPAQVSAALRSFNPARHSELKVISHTNGTNFSGLASVPNNSAVQWLQNATAQKSNELQISKQEAASNAPFAQFWSGILSSRASAGVFGQPPYDNTGKNIKAGDEINSMLSEQGKIKKQFSGVIGSKGDQYWELLEVDEKGVLTLGASFNKGMQMADVLYYASGGYYAAVTLYQLWPVDVGGKPSTLVWRGDLVSSGELADLRGVERLGSESALIKDVAKSVRAVRGEH
ncbi:MAG: hypothetical protein M3032_01240 [Verrucomicrobiota bacterium]|nr:hypothetical protein [Verrucomicrobiota bacterium]